jgi:hypothetical protein
MPIRRVVELDELVQVFTSASAMTGSLSIYFYRPRLLDRNQYWTNIQHLGPAHWGWPAVGVVRLVDFSHPINA